MNSVITRAINWALMIAADDSHGYSQINRTGNPDYDCSSFVIYAFRAAGLSLTGATYTGDMRGAFLRNGFTDVIDRVDLSTQAGLMPGDVLLRHSNGDGHTAIYLGNGRIVHAQYSENYTLHGEPGDQTGFEICTGRYYISGSGWTSVLRFGASGSVPIWLLFKLKKEGIKCGASIWIR